MSVQSRLDPDTGIARHRCDGWDDFINAMRDHARDGDGERLYRGHGISGWRLSSDFERHQYRPSASTLRELCDAHLDHFKDLAAGLLGNEARTYEENDWWAIGRHYGLSTPLLDWSRSPYLAAFFALGDYVRFVLDAPANGTTPMETDGFVNLWVLQPRPDVFREGEFELVAPKSFSNARQRAQRGVFTRLTHDDHHDVAAYVAHRGMPDCLSCWEIPGQDALLALSDLSQANITAGTVFPDLQGAALEANASYSRRFAEALDV